MKLETRNGVTTRRDGLPYDVIKTGIGRYEFRATGNSAKPVTLAVTNNEMNAVMMLVAQAPEGSVADWTK